jgi:hypothetical protein
MMRPVGSEQEVSMEKNDLMEQAEGSIVTSGDAGPARKKPSRKGRLILMMALLCVLVLVGIDSYNRVRRMYEPPAIPEDVLLEDMGAYLFLAVSRLSSFQETNGRLPETEEEFLGWDDPSIQYSTSGDLYTISVSTEDLVVTHHSGEDPGGLLSEDALRRMGVLQ